MKSNKIVGLLALSPFAVLTSSAQELPQQKSFQDTAVKSAIAHVDPIQDPAGASQFLPNQSSAQTQVGLDGALVAPIGKRAVPATDVADNPAPRIDPKAPSLADSSESRRAAFDKVFYDYVDGQYWVLGKNYKASADEKGFTFIPFLGSDAPQNYPVQFNLESATLGGQAMDLNKGSVSRMDSRIQIDRGPVKVWYDMDKQSVEQSFGLNVGQVAQNLELTLDVETTLGMTEIADGVRFQNELGGMDYRHALVFDAIGQELALPILASPGEIRLSVPASFMATAVAPIVVDPILSSYTVSSVVDYSLLQPDVAYDLTNDDFGFVMTSVFSLTDRDSRYEQTQFNGAAVGGTWLDFTGADITDSAIGNDNTTNTFLVAALHQNAPTGVDVVGWTIGASVQQRTGRFIIGSSQNSASGGAINWDNISVDVAGSSTSSSLFKVVWDRQFYDSSNVPLRKVIRTAAVTPDDPFDATSLPSVGSTFGIADTVDVDYSGSKISTSSGRAANGEWRIAFYGSDQISGDQFVHTARYADDNTQVVGATQILGPVSSSYTGFTLAISEGLDGEVGPFNGGSTYMLALYYEGPDGADIWLYTLDEETVYGFGSHLVNREHHDAGIQHAFPQIAACDDKFFLVYQEIDPLTNLFVTNYTVLEQTNQNIFGVSERRVQWSVMGVGFAGYAPAAASRWSGGSYTSRYVAAASETFDSVNGWYDMNGVTINGNGASTDAYQYCTMAANTTGDHGFIAVYGTNSTTGSKTLAASAMPLNQFGYFLAGQGGMGTTMPAGSTGLLCLLGAPIGRYNQGVEIKDTGTSGSFSLVIDPTSLRTPGAPLAAVAGATWTFQAWHRENGGDSNFTNAASLLFE